MALLRSFTSQISLLQSDRHPAILNAFLSETPIPPSISPQFSSISFSRQTVLRYPKFQPLRCSASSSSSVQDETFCSSKIFIKGLPHSMSEGRLQKAFSHYGEVSQVKLVVDRNSGQALGFAYIWFTSADAAKLAVKEMNGKVYLRNNCEARIHEKSAESNTLQVLAQAVLTLKLSLSSTIKSLGYASMELKQHYDSSLLI